MPILVDEIVISVEVAPGGEDAAAGGGGQRGGAASPQAEDRNALVNECVERVLEVLAERDER